MACWFVRSAIGAERYVRMVNAATGMNMTADEFIKTGERIWNLIRMFNAREGFTVKDDTLPERMLVEPLPSGVTKGHKLTRPKLGHMLDEYYELRGWDRRMGFPTKEKLRELKLDFVKSQKQESAIFSSEYLLVHYFHSCERTHGDSLRSVRFTLRFGAHFKVRSGFSVEEL